MQYLLTNVLYFVCECVLMSDCVLMSVLN